MNTALRICQQRYDDLLPSDTPAFLDTTAGANWLADAGERLVQGQDIQIGSCIVVQARELADLVALEALRRFEEHEDADNLLGQLLVAVANYDMPKASACLKSLFAPCQHPRGAINDMAEDLVRPFAEAAGVQMKRDAEDEAAEMRVAS